MGAIEIYDDKLGFKSLANDKKLSNTRFGSITETEPEKLKKHIKEVLPNLTFHEIKAVLSLIYQIKKRRYRSNAPPKYGSLNKGFSEQEVQAFFKVIENDKFRLLFGYQAQLGLRIGEAVKVNVKDIKFETRELTVKTEKAHVIDTMLIPVPLFKQTLEFINRNEKSIMQAGGYVFFAEKGHSLRGEPYLEKNYVRKVFREYVQAAKLDEVYDQSEETYGRTPRRLHRLTTHSLRHYAITSFARQNNGNVVLSSRFARHSDPSTTMTYINTRKDELYRAVDETFSLERASSLKAKLSMP
jgi:integrase